MKILEQDCANIAANFVAMESIDPPSHFPVEKAAWFLFNAAECTRRHGHFELASRLIDRVKLSTPEASAAIQRHRDLIARQSVDPQSISEITHLEKHPLEGVLSNPYPQVPIPQGEPVPPPLIVKGWNLAWATAKWIASGRPLRTREQMEAIVTICQGCEYLTNDNVCSQCGCSCQLSEKLFNKIAWATEKCPVGKWE